MGYFRKRGGLRRPAALSACDCEPVCAGFTFQCPTLVEQLREMRANGVRPDLGVVETSAFDGTAMNNWDVDPAGNIKVSRMDRVESQMNSWTRKAESKPAPASAPAPSEPTPPAEPTPDK